MIKFNDAEGWFTDNEKELFRYLKKRSTKVEARLTKTEIEKIIRRHLPFTKCLKWDEDDLVVEVDMWRLKRRMINSQEIWSFKNEIRTERGRYIICPILQQEAKDYFVVLQ